MLVRTNLCVVRQTVCALLVANMDGLKSRVTNNVKYFALTKLATDQPDAVQKGALILTLAAACK